MNDTSTEPSPDRRSIARWLLAAVALLVVAGMTTAIALALPRMKAARKGSYTILPDGTRVELLGLAQAGKLFTTDKPWVKAARRVLPARFQGWLPPDFTSVYTDSSVVFFVTPATGGRPVTWNDWFAEDDAGFRYRGDGSASGSRWSSGQYFYRLYLPAYPRRQKDFIFGVLGSSGATDAIFHISNPSTGPFPKWNPLRLPQTVTYGPVTLTLRALETHGTTNFPLITPRWTLVSTHPAWTDAAIIFASLLDATGNESPAHYPLTTRDSTNTVMAATSLSLRETAWKVRAKVIRINPGDFAASERAVLTNVAVSVPNVPGSPVERARDASANLNIEVVRQGQGSLSNGAVFLRKFQVSVWDRNPTPDDQLHYTVRDDHGRELSAVDPSGRPLSPTAVGRTLGQNGSCRVEFSPAPDAKFLSLEFHINRPLVFDFVVSPKDIQPLRP